jgi:uncharacterized protein
MGRLIVLVVLVVLAVWLVRRALRRSLPKDMPRKTPTDGELVRCAYCGLHLPRSEAHQAGGVLYCSDDHARLAKR